MRPCARSSSHVIWLSTCGAPPAVEPASRFNRTEYDLTSQGSRYTPEQAERLQKIKARLTEARRELDALIGDAYLRPRASIVPVHFLDLAAAAEKLRWAEKEWRELEETAQASGDDDSLSVEEDDEAELQVVHAPTP